VGLKDNQEGNSITKKTFVIGIRAFGNRLTVRFRASSNRGFVLLVIELRAFGNRGFVLPVIELPYKTLIFNSLCRP
jgi:hypothetical protein